MHTAQHRYDRLFHQRLMDLFSPLTIREITFRNRIAVSPMCQYSCDDGRATDWHLVHLGSRAVGGAGLVITEAGAVSAIGRISPGDLGIWKEEQISPLARIAAFVKQQGAIAGIQLAHAGRKASVDPPWKNGGATIPLEQGGWITVAPSPIPFHDGDRAPHQLTIPEIHGVISEFAAAAKRALAAGFQVIEIHGAHGYLIHEFLSPLSNQRTDDYGGSFQNRARFLTEVTVAIRREWPEDLPLFVRFSATDWVEGGWTVQDSVNLARHLKPLGVDLIDCSSGAIIPKVRITAGPGYQVPLAEQIRDEAAILTGAVGMITDAAQADSIIREGKADMVLLAREFLRDPYWPLHAARRLKADLKPPVQYERAYQ